MPRLVANKKNVDVIDGVLEFENQRFIASTVPISRIGCSLVGISPLTTFMADNGDYRTMILVVIAISLILFGTIIHLVANRLTKRLKILVKALKSMRNDNINVKIPVVSHDEIGELAVSFNLMTDRIYELIERVYKAQIMEKEYELKALEAHINPHFLYNSLSTISWMARKINAENIDNMAFLLSKFYRLVLSKGNSVITVQGEINHLKAYVEIERTRFGDSFQVIYDVDPESLDCKMIKIILQPIVENSIKHGLAAKDYRGTIIVRVKQDREYLYLTVIDDGIGMDSQVLESLNRGEDLFNSESGYGIRNIRERIKAVYGEKGQINIFSRPGVGCTVNITIPKTAKFLNL
ncbi:MAG: sensor histidine kinase [Clostridiales bacterium]|nr:sensor histidine kinase [Clostridiales bacterium]